VKPVKLVNVSKNYGRQRTLVRALRNVNFTLENGEIVLIMGPSGSGKTTFLSTVGGLLRPDTGKVILAGSNISKLEEDKRSRIRLEKTGFVFQTFNLLSALTAIENVEVPLDLKGVRRDQSREKAKEMLKEVNMNHRLHFFPKNLSSGEMQRTAIARALVNDPEVILADEPTGNLDSESGKRVMRLFKTLVKDHNKSAIIVTHDERIKKIADRVLWLEDGTFIKKRT
jgi:putative ABC transport system ATP-binding protein